MAMPPIIFKALKEQDPNTPDDVIVKSWPTLVDWGKQAGVDLETMDPYEVAKSLVGKKGQPLIGDPSINQAVIAQSIPVIGKKMPGENPANAQMKLPIPTEVTPAQSPYVGSKVTPGALLNQFDPAAMKAAQDEYDARRRTQHQGDIFTGFMSGISGNTANEAARRKAIQEDDLQRTVTAQKDRASQATAGLEAANKALTGSKDLQATQIEANKAALLSARERAELIGVLGNANTAQDLQDSKTDLSATSRVTARQQFVAAGYTPEQALLMVPDSMTGLAAIKATEGIPGALKAQTENINAQKNAAGIPGEVSKGRIQTATANTYAPGVPAPAPAAVSDKLFTTDEQRARALLDRAKANPAPAQSGAGLNVPPGGVPQVGGDGTVSVSFPGQTATQTGQADRNLKQADATNAYLGTIGPELFAANELVKRVRSGVGTETFAKWGASDQAELLTRLGRINAVYPAAFSSGPLAAALVTIDGKPGFSGKLLGSLNNETLAKLLKELDSNIQRSIQVQSIQETGQNKGLSPAKAAAVPYKAGVESAKQEAAAASAKAATRVAMTDLDGKTIMVPKDRVKAMEGLGLKVK